MIFFNIKSFVKFALKAVKGKDLKFQLTPLKWILVLLLSIFFLLLELFTWFCFWLDELLFPSYRKINEMEQSIFIIGNPRSGTTFLQRLLAKDKKNFTTMETWEILFAPTITQRKIFQMLNTLDQAFGKPFQRIFKRLEKRWSRKHQLHKIALDAPEEDQYLFVHNWSTISVWLFGGMIDNVDSYLYFDDEMPQDEKDRIMTFYKRCIQRHIYHHQGGNNKSVLYLSKNPSASPKIDSLYQYFSDPKLIYLVRNPLDMIPSYISLLDYTWNTIGTIPKKFGGKDFVLTMAKHWYYYPLERLEKAAEDSYIVVKFDDLVKNPQETVTEIYQRFSFEISGIFNQRLQEEAVKTKHYRSNHHYSLGEMGLDKKKLVTDFKYLFDRFQFDTG